MEVKVKVPEEVAAARSRGVSVEVYVEGLLARHAGAISEEHISAARAAIDRIRELRKGNELTGLRTKDLIHDNY